VTRPVADVHISEQDAVADTSSALPEGERARRVA
jgi:hypothetical protein